MIDECVVIDVYRFCSTVYAALSEGADKVYVTNDRFLPRKMKALYPSIITFGESKGIKLPWTDYDNSPVDVMTARVRGRAVMIRSSMGARRTERAIKIHAETYLASIQNYETYKEGAEDRHYMYDDSHDTYCLSLIRGALPDPRIEASLIASTRDPVCARACYARSDLSKKVRVCCDPRSNLLIARFV